MSDFKRDSWFNLDIIIIWIPYYNLIYHNKYGGKSNNIVQKACISYRKSMPFAVSCNDGLPEFGTQIRLDLNKRKRRLPLQSTRKARSGWASQTLSPVVL